MTTVIAGNGSNLDFDQLDLASLLAGTVTVANGAQITTSDSGINDNFFGTFTYDSGGNLTGGTLTRIQETYLGQMVFDITGTSVPVTTFLGWANTGNTLAAKQFVLGGADSIAGANLGDLLRAYDGNDVMAGNAGNDTLDGGNGNDTINGNDGNDLIVESAGSNYLRGDDGADSISGGAQFDDINGNMGNDTAHGNDGDDWVVGGKDSDLLFGDNGFDIVYGNMGDDTISGGNGADWVRGGQGNDSVSGGDGDDWLWGDRGDDTIAGGNGADIFHSFVGAGTDRVTDFSVAQGDKVQLDAGTAFTVKQSGSDTVVDMGNGDQVILVGVTASTLPPGTIFAG